ncbi:hypothetical protein BD309DRAFT_438682 [Dichomitus squalens]|nr:hypothetical protein BD309DRAFT_438682 [Dichomitus squalens]
MDSESSSPTNAAACLGIAWAASKSAYSKGPLNNGSAVERDPWSHSLPVSSRSQILVGVVDLLADAPISCPPSTPPLPPASIRCFCTSHTSAHRLRIVPAPNMTSVCAFRRPDEG